jgi:hypothetical protein
MLRGGCRGRGEAGGTATVCPLRRGGGGCHEVDDADLGRQQVPWSRIWSGGGVPWRGRWRAAPWTASATREKGRVDACVGGAGEGRRCARAWLTTATFLGRGSGLAEEQRGGRKTEKQRGCRTSRAGLGTDDEGERRSRAGRRKGGPPPNAHAT